MGDTSYEPEGQVLTLKVLTFSLNPEVLYKDLLCPKCN